MRGRGGAPKPLRRRFLGLAVIIALWNGYVALHAHGIIAGRVVDASGQPVRGATVTLFVRDFVNQQEHGRTVTDADGRFQFTKTTPTSCSSKRSRAQRTPLA